MVGKKRPSAKRSKRNLIIEEEEEPAAKRYKRNHDDYLPGNITMIELRNFMTFDHVVCKPAPRLNIVVGPNGSGKSSLVCAIALGLGGDPKLLGRASKVGAYVKRGETSGFIKITLNNGDCMGGESITITRNINTKGKSEWMYNDDVVTKAEVLEIIQKFNIQVNNLTQFLPQDRVCEFAKLTPVQLLEETEKAVGDPELPVLHRTLVDRGYEFKRLEVAVKQNRDSMNRLKTLNAEREKDVERFFHGKELLKKVELMKKKIPWLEYEKIKSDYVKAKKDETAASTRMERAAKVLSDFRVPIDEEKKAKAAHDEVCKDISDAIAANSAERAEKLNEECLLGVKVQGIYDEMEALRKQDESRHQRIETAKEELAAAEQALENLPIYEPPTVEYDQLGKQIVELLNSAKEKRFHKSDKESLLEQKKRALDKCLGKMTDMENASYMLLKALKKSGADKIHEAYRWLQEHRHEFKKEVYGPILLEITVLNEDHASYLEDHIASYIWKSFVTQDVEDRDKLVEGLDQFNVPVLNYVGGRGLDRVPFELSEEMQKLGICSRLDQVFDGPSAVKEVLINQFGLEYSYIGNEETDTMADQVPQVGISDLWTPENHYRWKKSRYGSHVTASVDAVSPSRLILHNADAGKIEKLRSSKRELEDVIADLEENCKKLQSEQSHLEEEAATLQRQREGISKTIQQEKRKRSEMESRVDWRRLKLETIVKEGDLETNLKKLADEAAEMNMKRFHLAVGIKDMIIQAASDERSLAEKRLTSFELEAMIREMEHGIKKQERAARDASKRLKECECDTETIREHLEDVKEHAESVAKITPELSQEFLQMPATIEELEAAIQDNTSQANAILHLNQNVLAEYERRQNQIEDIAKKVEADEEELKRCAADIDSMKAKWLPTLRNLVAQINDTFSRNFQEMAVAGEVSLDEKDLDFDQYGILIKVKFRKEGQLQILSAHHQSGGERSVSTLLYLVSLQNITNCPFRVVDEINQGMDPINERKVFQQLVRAASQVNTPQCFLLTPKLLPDLEYSDACSMLTVMNGPWIKGASKVWSTGESWGTVMG